MVDNLVSVTCKTKTHTFTHIHTGRSGISKHKTWIERAVQGINKFETDIVMIYVGQEHCTSHRAWCSTQKHEFWTHRMYWRSQPRTASTSVQVQTSQSAVMSPQFPDRSGQLDHNWLYFEMKHNPDKTINKTTTVNWDSQDMNSCSVSASTENLQEDTKGSNSF